MAEKTYILNGADITNKIKRLAFEVMENNFDEKEIILAGIETNGVLLALQIKEILEKESALLVQVVRIFLDKKNPDTIQTDPWITCNGKSVVVADDVSMTGKTMLYALQPFLKDKPKKIQTLVLVERQLKNFPVQSNFVGLHISTTLQEQIIVEQEQGRLTNAYLI